MSILALRGFRIDKILCSIAKRFKKENIDIPCLKTIFELIFLEKG